MTSAIRREILALEHAQADAINRGDIQAATKMFDRRFVGFSSTKHARIHGIAALARTFHYYRKHAPKMNYRIAQPHVQRIGQTAVATFYWTVGLGRGRTLRGRGTHVFVRQGRAWRVVHEHFSRAH